MKRIIAALAFTVAAAAVAAPAVAQPQGDYRYQGGGYGQDGLNLRGLSVNNAKSQLANAGFSAARSIKFNGQQYDLWSNGRSRQGCVGFTSHNGAVTDVRSFDDSECGLYGNGGGWGGGNGGGYGGSDIRGLSVDQAKQSLRGRGYTNTRNISLGGQQYDLWQSARGGDCVGFTSYKGKVTDTRSFRNSECNGGGGNGGGYGGSNGGWGNGPDRLVGLSVDGAKSSLSSNSFRKARSINLYGKQWDLWFDDRGRGGRCVGFTSYKGRVSDARNFDDGDCY